MPTIHDLIGKNNKDENKGEVAESTGYDALQGVQNPTFEKNNQTNTGENQEQPQQNEQGFDISGDFSNDPDEQATNESLALSAESAPLSTGLNQPTFEDPNSWSAEVTQRGFLAESGNSIMRGLGNYVVKGTGDLFQVAGAVLMPGMNMDEGNVISRFLQNTGGELAAQYQTFIPEELKNENFTYSSMLNSKFWSQNVAEAIPQLAEFIFLSKGGSALAKKGVGKLAKEGVEKGIIKGAKTTTRGKEVFGTGKGLIGKLVSDQGLTALGKDVVGAVGGGLTSNMLSGMLNAADVYNSNKDLKDKDGNPLFTTEQLEQMAAGTFTNNAKWLMVDMLSWGMTYGGGYKHLSKFGSKVKGPMWNNAQQSKVISKFFTNQTKPMFEGLAKMSGKALTEGFEETLQESWEEWSKQKAIEKVTGKPAKYENFMEFYSSDENRMTKAVSFALGGLGGGVFNMVDLINESADSNSKLYDRIENLKNITGKMGTEQENTWQEYHIRQQIAELVIEDKVDAYNEFAQGLIDNGNITEEQKVVYDEMVTAFQEADAKATRLNIKGRDALLLNVANEKFFETKILELQQNAQEKIDTINGFDMLDDSQKQKEIQKVNNVLERQVDALSVSLAEARQNQANLFIGKEASPLEISIETDKDGNEMIVGGLSKKQFQELTKEGESQAAQETAFEKVKKSKLTEQGKSFVDKIMSTITGKKKEESKKPAADETVLEDAPNTQNAETIEDVNKILESNPDLNEKLPTNFNELDDSEKIQTVNQILENEQLSNTNSPRQQPENIKETDSQQKASTDEEAEATTGEQIQGDNEVQAPKLSTIKNDIGAMSEAQVRNVLGQLKKKQEAQGPSLSKESRAADIKALEKYLNDKWGIEIKSDPNLSDAENQFISDEAKNQENAESIAAERERKRQQAIKNFKIKKANVDDADKKLGLDKRKKASVFNYNKAAKKFKNNFLQNVRKFMAGTNTENISKNDVDNYLNSAFTSVLYAPSDIDKMVAANHAVKRMFGSEGPEVFIVRNLFDSIGSVGLGHTLANTVFIDTKSWEQNDVFMHEMSHVYYKLTQDSPETKAMMDNAMKNKDLVLSVSKTYDDYILYNFDGKELTKGQILNVFKKSGGTRDQLGKFMDVLSNAGTLKRLPLSEQRYIREEVFAASLEGPLSTRFDKHFNPKNDFTRAKLAGKWWNSLKNSGQQLQSDGTFDMLLSRLATGEIPKGDRQAYIEGVFKEASEGITVDSFGLDKRSFENEEGYKAAIDDIAARKKFQTDNAKVKNFDDIVAQEDRNDALENSQEQDGISFFDKSFDSKIRGASKVLQDFGKAYQKALRTKFLRNNRNKKIDKRKSPVYNRDFFEATIFDLASEVDKANDFIYAIENSPIKEIRAFNRYLNTVKPNNKMVLLNSMYFVLSNRSVVNGVSSKLDNKGNHKLSTSLSRSEEGSVEGIMARLNKARKENDIRYDNFVESMKKIYSGEGIESDYIDIINYLTNNSFNLEKVLEQGYVTYQGVNYPIDMLLAGFIKSGRPFNQKNPNNGVYIYSLRPIIEALIATNRKFTPLSSVKNAEGNQEPVRIVNNHMTKELGNMIDFLETKPTKDEFIDRYSHVGSPKKDSLGRRYVPNSLLEMIYDNYQQGTTPTLSQYHGLEDVNNSKGNLYKNSSDIEQTIEDMLMYRNTAFTDNGRPKKSYLGNMGSFSDSPRKFFLNMPRIAFKDMFNYVNDGKKLQFAQNGKLVNAMYNLHQQIKGDGISKSSYKKQLQKAIGDYAKVVKDNSTELSKVNSMKDYFTNGKLNRKGNEFVAEYVMNSIMNGYNVADVFAPNINQKNIVKRFKLNSSPIMSVRNPNFKIEPMPFADELINGSESGTDSAMYILKEDAEKWQRLGKGVFDMNGGFKFLNASIEKTNPNFKGKTAYLKGYTTIIDDKHPLYKAMKERKDKYNKYHQEKYGAEVSQDLTDGSPNHMVIAMSVSSDKSNFFEGLDTDQLTPDVLANNTDAINKYLDKTMYSKGDFVGIESYNFGPQQLMDKKTDTSNFPVQLMNSIMVNASINGNIEVATEIQQLLADQQRANLQQYLNRLKTGSMEEYRSLIMDGLNKEGMDQAQRMLLEDNGSLSHPYVTEIVINQLAKSIRRKGNKLETAGSYSHQKPDIGYNVPQELRGASARLSGYRENGDGTLQAMEAVLPTHMEGKYEPRKAFTFSTHTIKDRSKDEALGALKSLATKKAKRRAVLEGYPETDFEKFMGESKDANGGLQGYWVKGESVLMSRVPGHGPASTGVFEVMGYDTSEGNQVMVPSEFNDIIGSDNDGDALFIQARDMSKPKYNEAFTKIKKLWLSEGMNEQIRTQMSFEENVQEIVTDINDQLGKTEDNSYSFPFSPTERMRDYNNTMVSKRLVGTVFNLHKIANLLATYETEVTKPIQIGSATYDKFSDTINGNESRNQQSAVLANIILDNAKWGFADSLGLNEFTTAQAVLMTNMGVPLKDIGLILNSKIAKEFSRLNKNNNSIYHESKSKASIINKLYTDNKLKRDKNSAISIDTSNIDAKKNEAAIIELLSYLSDMNGDLQKISGVMSGHNKIHVNPFVLEKQINDAKDLLGGNDGTIKVNEDLKSNPELQRYLDVAEETLNHTRRINPVYRRSIEKVLDRLNSKVSDDLSTKQIETFSRDVLKFTTSRLLGHNNVDREYAKDLIDPNSDTSIFAKLSTYLNDGDSGLRNQILEVDGENVLNSVSGADNSYLFRKALKLSLEGNDKFINANTSFVNDSMSEQERQQVQQEFNELPAELRDDLILYDLIKNGWKGPLSLAPFFPSLTNAVINNEATNEFDNKNDAIGENVLREVEKIVALKKSLDSNNPFNKLYVKNIKDARNINKLVEAIGKNKSLKDKVSKGQPFYLNVRSGRQSELYEFQGFEKPDIAKLKEVQRTKGLEAAKAAAVRMLSNRLFYIENNLIGNGDVNLSTINDNGTGRPFKTFDEFNGNNSLEPMTEATINYEEAIERIRKQRSAEQGLDAREDYDIEMFESSTPLTYDQFERASEFENTVNNRARKQAYDKYKSAKAKANEVSKDINYDSVKDYETNELLDMYEVYGDEDAYAYSIVMTPIIKELASRIAAEQSKLTGNTGSNSDVNAMKSYLMTGSNIPSDHPAAQGMARMMEVEYKKFLTERSKLMKEKQKITDALYKEKLGYGVFGDNLFGRIANTARRVLTSAVQNRSRVYDRLYGNLVDRKEVLGSNGKYVFEYKLKPKKQIESDFKNGFITQAEKDFYDFFRKTTNDLKPKDLKSVKEDYVPHAAMSKLEAFSARGILGLLTNSKKEDQRLYDVRLKDGDEMITFKQIEDNFKAASAGSGKNSLLLSKEYLSYKRKAEKLLKQGKNEDGSDLKTSITDINTVLGFGAINRFSNNRSIKSTEMPTMDLDKALSDYIHSTVFVNGFGEFQGMKRLQAFIDGTLAHNRAMNKNNLNNHVQKVWKDFFLRNKVQESSLGKNADKIIRMMTKLNVFYGLGIKAGVQGGGQYAIGNALVGKYNNIKDVGGKRWLKGELKFWGLDSLRGGPAGIFKRHKRMINILKNLNYMNNNVYDDISIEKRNGLDSVFTNIMLSPMIASENWIQKVHTLGYLTDEMLDKFDENGNYKPNVIKISPDELVEIEDKVKSQHGRGYNITDQRAVQMYSWGNMMMQYAKFIPTMFHDRFAKRDVNIYGREHIGSLRASGDMLRYAVNNPEGVKEYYKGLSNEEKDRLKSALRGFGMSVIIASLAGAGNNASKSLFWDSNYYYDIDRLKSKLVPGAIKSTENLVNELF